MIFCPRMGFLVFRLILCILALCQHRAFFDSNSLAQEENNVTLAQPAVKPAAAGKIFDLEVPRDNYFFVKGVLSVFGNKFGDPPRDSKEEEDCIWDQLVLSYEAYRRGVNVSPEELEIEVKKILEGNKAAFDFKSDRPAYEKWVKENINASVELFENQIRHLIQLRKTRQQVMDSVEPQVSKLEAKQEFLNEYNSLSVELAEFTALKEARDFYNKAKSNPGFWEREKALRAGEFRNPGFVALEFLMDIWKFPKDAAYKMLKLKTGSFYPPIPIYKGYGVCKVLEARLADEKDFRKEAVKESYYQQLRTRKKHEVLDGWFKNLKKQARIEVYE